MRFRLGVLLAAVILAIAAASVTSSSADVSPTFAATFDTPTDLAAQFDYGYSGHRLVDNPTWHGDHDLTCGAPTTLRDVAPSSDVNLDFSPLFYWCGPPSPTANGHLMTVNDTTGYNIAWFSPKPTFTGITKVCWDANETQMSGRKWMQVVFVSDADAHRYPAGTVTFPAFPPNGVARGTGGFDLGYVSPEFKDPNGPTTRIISSDPTFSGFKSLGGSVEWWNSSSDFLYVNFDHSLNGITDKATRYQQCLEQQSGSVRFTRNTPNGLQTFDIPGAQIPSDARRVVFEDDVYDSPKATNYTPDAVTWHWDNIQVFADGTTGPPATTVAPATTAVPPTTVSPCPTSFAADALAWCATVEARLDALGG